MPPILPRSVALPCYDELYTSTDGANFDGEIIQAPRRDDCIAMVDRIAYAVNRPSFVAPPPAVVAHQIVLGWVTRGGSMADGQSLLEMLKDDSDDHFFTLLGPFPWPRHDGSGDFADLQIWTTDGVVANPRKLTVAYHWVEV